MFSKNVRDINYFKNDPIYIISLTIHNPKAQEDFASLLHLYYFVSYYIYMKFF